MIQFLIGLHGERRLPKALLLRVHAGRQWFSRNDLAGPDYFDSGATLEWQRGRFGARLAFTDTDAGSACADLCDAQINLILELAH